MSTVERINLHVQQLPQPFQLEVLNFIEFLSAKLAAKSTRKEEELWSQFSLAQAMRGMEDEEGPIYTKEDLKEVWK